jgi:hypothetical protein
MHFSMWICTKYISMYEGREHVRMREHEQSHVLLQYMYNNMNIDP